MAMKVGGVVGERRFSVDCVLVVHVSFAILSRLAADLGIFVVSGLEVLHGGRFPSRNLSFPSGRLIFSLVGTNLPQSSFTPLVNR